MIGEGGREGRVWELLVPVLGIGVLGQAGSDIPRSPVRASWGSIMNPIYTCSSGTDGGEKRSGQTN